MPWFAPRDYRAVASFFFCGGGGMGDNIASAEGTNFVGGSGGILLQKVFKFGDSEALFSHFSRNVSEKSTSI